jgi:twitching motility protein PilT
MAEIDKLFKLMVSQNASDMHLSAGTQPFFRIHGEMVGLNHPALENDAVQALIFEILSEKQKRLFMENWELDTSYHVPGLGRFRVNVFMQRRGMGGVFRVIPEIIKSAKELNLPQGILDLIDTPRGLVLVTGPTGSGKSTTLASLIHEINIRDKAHIITIEDPIEFVHENKMSLINQREVSSHTKSFANALKASLREDPDIILVGELRDLETIQLAMTAAETGHLVFGTLHTNNAPKTVDRIIDVFPQAQQSQIRTMLSESLRGVVAQTLFPRVDKPGRIAAYEVLTNTHAVANLIRESKTHQIPSVMQTQMDVGMMTFEYHLGKLVNEGKVDKLHADTFLGKKTKKEPVPQTTQPGISGAIPNISKASGIVLTGVEKPAAPGTPAQKPAPPQAAAGGLFNRKK